MKVRTRFFAVMAVVAAAAPGASCTPTTECDYIDREVADPLHPTEDDMAYCWQGFNAFGLHAYRFERGEPNLVFLTFPPNAFDPAGGELVSRWTLDPDVQTPAGPVAVLNLLDLVELPEAQVEVNRTSLIMADPSGARALRRAVCRGFGFETSDRQCRGGASRP